MILYTLDRKEQKKYMKKISFTFLIASLFCMVFAAVYEDFSHQVYSGYMIFAFIIPLVGGALPFLMLALLGRRFPGRAAVNLYNSGIAALTVGSIMLGVLEIYGTTNGLTDVYWLAGGAFAAAGILLYIVEGERRTNVV